MSPDSAFRVIESKPIFEDLNISTEIQFSTDVAQVGIHAAHLDLSLSSNKKTKACPGLWHLYSGNDTCERSKMSAFQMKGNTKI